MIDEKKLLENFDNDWVLIKDIATLCLEKLPEYRDSIKAAIDKIDFAGLELSAHTLKGSVSYFDNQELVNLALSLEISGREKKNENLNETFNKLYVELESLLVDLKVLEKQAEDAA